MRKAQSATCHTALSTFLTKSNSRADVKRWASAYVCSLFPSGLLPRIEKSYYDRRAAVVDKKKDIVEDETDDNQEQELERQEKIDDEFGAEVAAENSENMESKEVDVEFLQGQLEKLQEQSKVSLDKVVRAQAEMENLRKRAARDVENAHKYALEKFTNELLPIMDSLELGLSASVKAKNLDDLCKGMELTLEMFNTVMEKFGITMIEPKGEKFNPELHDAVSMQETDDSNSGIIIEVMQKGYTLNGRLIRPAMVVVAK